MSKRVFFKAAQTARLDMPINPISSRIFTFVNIDGELYGFDDKPYNYLYGSTYGTFSAWYYAEQSITHDANTAIGVGFQGSVEIPRPSLYFALEEDSVAYSTMIGRNPPTDVKTLNGRYNINGSIVVNYTDIVPRELLPWHISIFADFLLDDTLYKALTIELAKTSATTTDRNYHSVGIVLYDVENTPHRFSIPEFSSVYNGKVIEFNECELPLKIAEWFESFIEEIYPFTYEVKTYSGETVLARIVDAPAIKKSTLTVLGNQKTLILLGVNDREYSLQWVSDTPPNKTFTGLSYTENSNRVQLPPSISVEVYWQGATLYEVYGTYHPPATTFDINLYQNSAEVNRVDKSNYLVGVGTLSGALREECSMLTPSIVYQSSDVPTFNYVYITIFNRYYYVTSLSSVSKNVWRMELKCDVLMTYKNEIRSLQGVIKRQENDFNPLLVDDMLPTQTDPEIEVVNIPSEAFSGQLGLKPRNFVLTTILTPQGGR